MGETRGDHAQVNYTSAQYPTPEMVQEDGRRCGCLDWFKDVCRVEFRRVCGDLRPRHIRSTDACSKGWYFAGAFVYQEKLPPSINR